jgi:hypothetical protein
VLHREIEIPDNDYQIKASLKIPDNENSKTGIILVHGVIVNRHSLSRKTYSLGEYLCKELEAYVITPDLLGETIYKKQPNFKDSSKIINITIDYLSEEYDLDALMGFAHSQGCYYIVQSIQSNNRLKSIVNFGAPTKEAEKISKTTLMISLMKYISFIKSSINMKKFTNYIYDEETCNYLYNVMMKNERFGHINYDFNLDLKIYKDYSNIFDEYINLIKKWGKPTLLLFGTRDTLVDNTRNYYYDGYQEDNITVKHLPECSHITPCMESVHQLSKLSPVIQFFKKLKHVHR